MFTLPLPLTRPDPLPLHPALVDAFAQGPQAVSALPDGVGPGVYRVPLLDPQWCAELADGVARIEAEARDAGGPLQAPNSMHSYGVLAADLALDPLLGRLVAEVVVPLARDLYPEVGAASLDAHHGFVVHYGAGWDHDLSLHVDDSEVTVNLCLGREFRGGGLRMSGRRCRQHVQGWARPGECFDVAQEPGFALLHAGMHRHEALPLHGGERLNLILWCRSAAFRAHREGGCPDWCGA